jgi:hypothetical protein
MTMGAQIPVIAEKPLAACGCRKFQLDAMGDHLCTCTAHSGAKKAHDWAVDQLADLFRTTHTVKAKHVTKSRGRHCGDVELAAYLANAAGPVPLVLNLRIAHDRFGSSSDLNLNGHLHYPNDIDRSFDEAAADKIRKYRADYNINPPNATSFMPASASTSGRLHSEFVRLLFFSLRILPVDSSTSAARRSPRSLKQGSATSLLRLQLYELILTLMGRLSQEHILTHHTRKLLVY